ncbi:putative amino acid transporter [Leucosporidium creatinivorum]|uniref:Putative amino acid transporter n=1 Tax=Leucosporidium creatinivorum TaxID=106004 RepID=A0A1Y2G0M4_9BASI|nr:putative amino acid transporter [Leucosporidium creatinivorum]
MVLLNSSKELEKDGVEVEAQTTYARDLEEREGDAVFGEVEAGGHDYTNLTWWRGAAVLTKIQLGMGVLGIPQVFSTVGMVPGIIMLLVIALMTSWSSYVIGKFKVRHPEVGSIGDAAYILWGPIGREVLGGVYWLYMVCSAGSGMLSAAIAFNAITLHGACTVVFVVVSMIIAAILASIQTLSRVSILGYIGLVSILSAILTVTIAVAVQGRPDGAPPASVPWAPEIKAFGSPTFAEAANCLGTLVFAYGAVPASFQLVAELKRPQDFIKTASVAQSVITSLYLTIGVVLYVYAGDHIASPALGTAGPMMKRICYGLGLPALLVSATLFSHFSAKYLFVRALRGSRHLTANSATHWLVWGSSVLASVVIAFLIAEGVPFFDSLISLVGSLFATVMCLQFMGCMWFYDHWQDRHTDKTLFYRALVFWNAFIIVIGSFITVAGSYGAVESIIESLASGDTKSFGCADNSNSV